MLTLRSTGPAEVTSARSIPRSTSQAASIPGPENYVVCESHFTDRKCEHRQLIVSAKMTALAWTESPQVLRTTCGRHA